MAADRKGESLAKRMIGSWRLASRVDRAADDSIRTEPTLGSDPLGMLTYTRDRFSAQFMKRDRSDASVTRATGSGQNNTTASGGYDAYFGTYHVGMDGSVLHQLEAAITLKNVGMEVARTLTVEGDRLTIVLKTSAPDGEPITRTLTWNRIV
jgi:Lipocalin-like domain